MCMVAAIINWDAISAISQLVGSLAVVLSVLYLAVQVHQSTRVARLATQDAAATALRDVTKPLMENAELERIWRVGLEDISALSIEERADRKSTRLNSSHVSISYAVFCLK